MPGGQVATITSSPELFLHFISKFIGGLVRQESTQYLFYYLYKLELESKTLLEPRFNYHTHICTQNTRPLKLNFLPVPHFLSFLLPVLQSWAIRQQEAKAQCRSFNCIEHCESNHFDQRGETSAVLHHMEMWTRVNKTQRITLARCTVWRVISIFIGHIY